MKALAACLLASFVPAFGLWMLLSISKEPNAYYEVQVTSVIVVGTLSGIFFGRLFKKPAVAQACISFFVGFIVAITIAVWMDAIGKL